MSYTKIRYGTLPLGRRKRLVPFIKLSASSFEVLIACRQKLEEFSYTGVIIEFQSVLHALNG